MIGIAIGLVALCGAVAFVGYQKTRNAASAWASIASTLDRSVRTAAIFASAPALTIAVWLVWKGVDPPAAIAVGLVAWLGVWVVWLGLLSMEGALVEKESEAAARQALGQPPPSTPTGRAIAIALGAALIGLVLCGVWMLR